MDLDTSSFWVLDYSWGGAGSFTGERVCYVEKDTMIYGVVHAKVVCYTSKGVNIPITLMNAHLTVNNPISYFMREDTIDKKLYLYSSTYGLLKTIVFNLNINDSIEVGWSSITQPMNQPIDSITYPLYLGHERRTIFGTHLASIPYSVIEGIGASHSFPEAQWGEWGIPYVTCKCYSKGGAVLYKSHVYPFSQDSCYKKPMEQKWPLGLNDRYSNESNIIYSNNSLRVNGNNGEYFFKLVSIQGQAVFSKLVTQSSFTVSFESLPKGIYILSIQSSNGIENRKILIQ